MNYIGSKEYCKHFLSLRALKIGAKSFLERVKTQNIFCHYYETCDKILWQNSSLRFEE